MNLKLILFFLFMTLTLLSQPDKSQTLSWSTYYGGANTEYGIHIASDSIGNVYTTGITLSSNFPVSSGAFQTIYAGDSDLFLIKFNTLGQRLWATYYGGTAYDEGRSVTIDKNGDIILTGITRSTDFPVTFGAFQTTNAGNNDLFIIKFNNQGQRLWATYFGGSDNDYGEAIFTDADNNIYISGYTGSVNFPVTAGCFQQTNSGAYDAFIIKLTSNGQRLWATYFGGSFDDDADAIGIDLNNDFFITGVTNSVNLPVTAGAFQTFNAGLSDAYIAKFRSDGQRIWCTYYGGTENDLGFGGITSNSNNQIFTGGRTSSPNFPVTPSAFQINYGGNSDAYIIIFNSTGERLYASYLGGSGSDYGEGISINMNSFILSGFTSSTNFPVTIDAYQYTNSGLVDCFMAVFNFNGDREYASYIGGANIDESYTISSNLNSKFALTGRTNSLNFPFTQGAFQNFNSGNYDIFISYFNRGNIGIEPIGTTLPTQFSLSQNYPNPFNPSTNFEFSIPKSGFVNLTIYDVLGREVETLVNNELKAGIYRADWNASAYPSGVYYYRLSSASFSETKKMILIK